jgi:hypothetical protein
MFHIRLCQIDRWLSASIGKSKETNDEADRHGNDMWLENQEIQSRWMSVSGLDQVENQGQVVFIIINIGNGCPEQGSVCDKGIKSKDQVYKGKHRQVERLGKVKTKRGAELQHR